MTFVEYVRLYHKEQEYEDLAQAINRAIDRCIEENVLADFLSENRTEVVKVTQMDYTFDRQLELERDEARQEGFQEGRKEGQLATLYSLVSDKIITVTQAAEQVGISEQLFKEKMMEYQGENC